MIEILHENIRKTMLCAGIDPDISKIPKFRKTNNLKFYLKNYIDATINYVCCYKVQKAFFDYLDNGKELLKFTINYIHKKQKNIPVIIDCKIGDIENTMKAYLDNIFKVLNADGVVVNPYMGKDVLDFASEYPNKIFAVLVRTSNQGADIFQNLEMSNGEKLWESVLKIVMNDYNINKNIVPILARMGNELKPNLYKIIKNSIVLFAGTGTQNGDLNDLKCLFNSNKDNVFFNVSRKIMYPTAKTKKDYFKEIENAAREYMEYGNGLRK